MLVGYIPFTVKDKTVMEQQIKDGKLMLEIDPNERITIEQIFEDEWVENLSPEYEYTLKRTSIGREVLLNKLQFPLPDNNGQPKK
ncbi:hypothetical protein QTN25_010856 [Entamoeba marina]